MTEQTTFSASKFDLLPCSYCGKQPELVEEPRYYFNCPCSASIRHEYPSVGLAAENWNFVNDFSKFSKQHDEDYGWEPGCESVPDISPSRTLHGYREFSAVPGLLARLKPCPFCGAQPEILECPNPSDYGYFVRCLCHTADTFAETILQRTPEDAAAVWNRRAEPKGIFPALKKRLALFFSPYDLWFFVLLSIFMLIPFTIIAGLRELEFDFLRRCLIVFQAVFFSATVFCTFAFLRWLESDEEKDSSL
ncbi:Lar family restriction alleviation protein [Candidatus Electronema sp. JC]|uniref:Lar family restriction alleviation protein n=1 Tax=Candidatus Electronema sp. JC TaxID=3401570 RepID=UPI003B43348A